MDREKVVHCVLFSIKRKEALTAATTQLNLEGIMPGQTGRKEEDKYYMIPAA